MDHTRDSLSRAQARTVQLRPRTGVDSHHVLFCPGIDTKAHSKAKDACCGHERAVGHALPLVPTPEPGRLSPDAAGAARKAGTLVASMIAKGLGELHSVIGNQPSDDCLDVKLLIQTTAEA